MRKVIPDPVGQWKIANTWALRASQLEGLWLACDAVSESRLARPTSLAAFDALVRFVEEEASAEKLREEIMSFLKTIPGYDLSRPATVQSAAATEHLGYLLMQLGQGKFVGGRDDGHA